jgi:hypothetical protein
VPKVVPESTFLVSKAIVKWKAPFNVAAPFVQAPIGQKMPGRVGLTTLKGAFHFTIYMI